MATFGLFLSFFLTTVIASTLSSEPKAGVFEIEKKVIPSDRHDFVPSVESIVDSRFKSLANDFQDQIDNLKDEVVRLKDERNANSKGGLHEIHKRQTNTAKSTRPYCLSSASLCSFYYPDHPDAGLRKGNYSTTVTNEMLQDPSKIKIIQTNCGDLQQLGHKLSGLYLVKTSRPNQPKKIETVFCNFQSPLAPTSYSQDFIGNVDIKTKSIHFYVTRVSSFKESNAVVPFELSRLNEGGAMDLTSGIFTVPVPGIYHFEFSGLKSGISETLSVYLQVNGEYIGVAYTDLTAATRGINNRVSLSVSLRLNESDRVNLFKEANNILADDDDHHTHFSGWLVEEDLI